MMSPLVPKDVLERSRINVGYQEPNRNLSTSATQIEIEDDAMQGFSFLSASFLDLFRFRERQRQINV